MANKSTPIENIINNNNNNNNNNNQISNDELSTAQQVLQKYNEYETDDNDEQLQRRNERAQNIQMDTVINQQQRIDELERIEQENIQLHKQNQEYVQTQDQNKNKGFVGDIIDKIKNIIQLSTNKIKDAIIVCIIFIALNLEIVCKLFEQYIPFDLSGFNGVVIKGVLSGVLYYIVSTLLVIL